MDTLPPSWRENVIYLMADGTILANRPELKAEYEVARSPEHGMLEAKIGRAFVPYSDSLDGAGLELLGTCNDIGTGAYRRVATKLGYGFTNFTKFAYAKVILDLPSEVGGDISFDANFETPHVYLGGTGASYSGGSRTEVDAGFMYFSDQSFPSGGWEMIIHVAGNYVFGAVFEPNSAPTLEFLVPSNGNVSLHASGGQVDPASTGSVTIAAAATGWRKDGKDNSLKRVTAIAQLQGQQDLQSGAYLSVDWHGAIVGHGATTSHPWSNGDNATDCSYPTSAIAIGSTDLGSGPDAANEKVTIDLQ